METKPRNKIFNPHCCSDNNCILGRTGAGTNGGCRCVMKKMHYTNVHKLKLGILWLRDELNKLID